ncbi:hypothetical protein [uncultured Alistipes sp.]|jgi:hypothetical protein|uniref:hypothetical protein n=1 Tax=uncultured Alistipes sp. TaxID=538949 RepID=UPI0025FA7A86|nr:hypothetical protein [uncultured Alistipes sp.]
MKKIVLLFACTTLVLSFTNCSKNNKTAGEAAKEYAEKLHNGDYAEFVDFIYFEPGVNADTVKQQKTTYATAAKKHVQHKVESKGGVKAVEVVSEEPIAEGKVTNVVLRQDYNNGDTENVHVAMVLDQGDVWKVRLGKDKEVWKVHYADGTKGTFKLKEDDHREILKAHVDGERDFVKEEDTDNKTVLKVKKDGEKDVLKIKEKENETVTKVKHDGEKEVVRVKKEKE